MVVLACLVDVYNTAEVPLSRAGQLTVNPPQMAGSGTRFIPIGWRFLEFKRGKPDYWLISGLARFRARCPKMGERHHPYAYSARPPDRRRSGLGRRRRHSGFVGRACDLEWLPAAPVGYRR